MFFEGNSGSSDIAGETIDYEAKQDALEAQMTEIMQSFDLKWYIVSVGLASYHPTERNLFKELLNLG